MRISINIPLNSLSFLVGFNLLLFTVLQILLLLVGGSDTNLLRFTLLQIFGALSGDSIFQLGEIWRMVASAFLHVDIFHLAFNMIALFHLGKIIYTYYGGKLLFVFYILSGLGGSLFSILLLESYVPTVGASGAVFGLVGVLLAGSMKRTPYGLELPFRPIDVMPLLVYSILLGLADQFGVANIGINNAAHLGGFLVGAALGWVFSHQLVTWRERWQKRAEKGLYYACIGIFVLTYVAVIVDIAWVLF